MLPSHYNFRKFDGEKSKSVVFDKNPGRNAQTYGIARELGTDMDLIHEPSVGVIGTKGDSQCYLGVQRKVEAIHEHLRQQLGHGEGQMSLRLVQPEYTVATSDGMRNGTREMRYSLIGRRSHMTRCVSISVPVALKAPLLLLPVINRRWGHWQFVGT